MKRVYKKATLTVILLQNEAQLVAGSDYNKSLNAPTWGDKALEFGGWDVEWEEEEL